MEDKFNRSVSGVNFFELLTIAFIVLKLTKAITWKWIWVISPLWFELLLSLIPMIFVAIIKKIRRRRRKK